MKIGKISATIAVSLVWLSSASILTERTSPHDIGTWEMRYTQIERNAAYDYFDGYVVNDTTFQIMAGLQVLHAVTIDFPDEAFDETIQFGSTIVLFIVQRMTDSSKLLKESVKAHKSLRDEDLVCFNRVRTSQGRALTSKDVLKRWSDFTDQVLAHCLMTQDGDGVSEDVKSWLTTLFDITTAKDITQDEIMLSAKQIRAQPTSYENVLFSDGIDLVGYQKSLMVQDAVTLSKVMNTNHEACGPTSTGNICRCVLAHELEKNDFMLSNSSTTLMHRLSMELERSTMRSRGCKIAQAYSEIDNSVHAKMQKTDLWGMLSTVGTLLLLIPNKIWAYILVIVFGGVVVLLYVIFRIAWAYILKATAGIIDAMFCHGQGALFWPGAVGWRDELRAKATRILLDPGTLDELHLLQPINQPDHDNAALHGRQRV